MTQPAISEEENENIPDSGDWHARRIANWRALGVESSADIRDCEDNVVAEILSQQVLQRLDCYLSKLEALASGDDEQLVPMSYIIKDVVIAGLQQGLRDAASSVRPCKHCQIEIAIFGSGKDATVLTLATGNHHHRDCQGAAR